MPEPDKPEPDKPTRKPFKFLSLPPDFCPTYCSLDEACSYARHGRWYGHQKIRKGRWRTLKDGRRTVVVFASVLEDMERLQAASAASDAAPDTGKRRVGRPRKPIDAQPQAAR